MVKELNAHAGRLGTMLSIGIALVGVSAGTGPIHDALAQRQSVSLYCALLLLGVAVAFTVLSLHVALEPAVAIPIEDQAKWEQLIHVKARECNFATRGLGFIVVLLSLAWMIALSVEPRSVLDIALSAGLLVSPLAIGVLLLLRTWHGKRSAG